MLVDDQLLGGRSSQLGSLVVESPLAVLKQLDEFFQVPSLLPVQCRLRLPFRRLLERLASVLNVARVVAEGAAEGGALDPVLDLNLVFGCFETTDGLRAKILFLAYVVLADRSIAVTALDHALLIDRDVVVVVARAALLVELVLVQAGPHSFLPGSILDGLRGHVLLGDALSAPGNHHAVLAHAELSRLVRVAHFLLSLLALEEHVRTVQIPVAIVAHGHEARMQQL